MKRNWWKWLGVLLTGYALVGGLSMPMKTGITGVRLQGADSLHVASGRTVMVETDIYNFGDSFQISDVILKNDAHVFRSRSNSWDPNGTITSKFQPHLGSDNEGDIYTLYVKGNGQWMAFPGALSIVRSAADSGVSNSDSLTKGQLEADPDFLKGFPNRPILNESIRNLLYHVPLWFSMIAILAIAAIYAIRYLSKGNMDMDMKSDALIRAAMLAGVLGCLTGSVWASITWDSWWPRDPKLNGVAIGMLMYMAYFLLRAGIRDEHQRARVSSVYNLFVFPIFIALIVIMPKISGDSLHPGAGGTVTFKQYDMDNTMRMFFYPAVAGTILLYCWFANLIYRYKKLEYNQILDSE
jgi:heme exporter protein C